MTEPDAIAQALTTHWQEVFSAKPVDQDKMDTWLRKCDAKFPFNGDPSQYMPTEEDPYFKVNFNGQQNDGRKEHFIKNNDPLVYKTIIMDKDLTAPKVAMYMPQVNIQVWDWDPSVSDSFNSDDYLGCCFHTFTEDEIIDIKDTDEDDGLPIKPPRWIDLMNEEPGDSEGSVLASFQLIRLSAPDQAASFTKKFPPPLIIPNLQYNPHYLR